MNAIWRFCSAFRFQEELLNCCHNGKVRLSSLQECPCKEGKGISTFPSYLTLYAWKSLPRAERLRVRNPAMNTSYFLFLRAVSSHISVRLTGTEKRHPCLIRCHNRWTERPIHAAIMRQHCLATCFARSLVVVTLYYDAFYYYYFYFFCSTTTTSSTTTTTTTTTTTNTTTITSTATTSISRYAMQHPPTLYRGI
ncbi:hypothetical protein FHG87_013725 [Trinorchestia longiramus]|nr:hypothetical protein FHG87_013725 [Trinorchestia longiramus]